MEKKHVNQLTKILLTLAVVFVIAIVSGTVSKAAQGEVTGLKQTDAGTGSVSVEWDTSLEVSRYYVSIATEKNGDYVSQGQASLFSHDIITGLNAGRTYWVKVQGYIGGNDGYWGPESEPLEVVTLPNSSPSEIKHVGSTYTSISLSWPEVAGANIYEVSYVNAASMDASVKVTTTTPSVKLTGLAENKEYRVSVRPGRMNSTGTFVRYFGNSGTTLYQVPVQPTKVTGLDVPYYWENLAELKLECDQNVAADGYEWELYTAYNKNDKRLKKADSSAPGVYLKHSALKKHNFYKIRVRAYSMDSNNKKYYSKWTSWRYTCPQPDMKLKKTTGGIKASWDKIKGADRYVIYASTKQESGYKKIATTKKTSMVISKIKKKALKSGKTYYFYVEAQNKVGKKYYSGEAGNQLDCWKIEY